MKTTEQMYHQISREYRECLVKSYGGSPPSLGHQVYLEGYRAALGKILRMAKVATGRATYPQAEDNGCVVLGEN